LAMKHRYDSHVNTSSAAGAHTNAFAAWRSVGIGWSIISRKNSLLSTMMLRQSPGNVGCATFREYQIRASLIKLNRDWWMTRAAFPLRVCAEEYRRSEHPFERVDQPPVLRAAQRHPERIQHFSRGVERNGLTLLTNRQSREEDRHQPILSPRQPVLRMPSDLQHEMAVPALVQELTLARPLDWQSAEYKRTGSEPEVLVQGLTVRSYEGYLISASELLLWYDQFGVKIANYITGALKAAMRFRLPHPTPPSAESFVRDFVRSDPQTGRFVHLFQMQNQQLDWF
jgi:hypothetical protein